MTLETESLHQQRRRKVQIEEQRKVVNPPRWTHSNQVRVTYALLRLRMGSLRKLPTNPQKIPKLHRRKVRLNHLWLTVWWMRKKMLTRIGKPRSNTGPHFRILSWLQKQTKSAKCPSSPRYLGRRLDWLRIKGWQKLLETDRCPLRVMPMGEQARMWKGVSTWKRLVWKCRTISHHNSFN